MILIPRQFIDLEEGDSNFINNKIYHSIFKLHNGVCITIKEKIKVNYLFNIPVSRKRKCKGNSKQQILLVIKTESFSCFKLILWLLIYKLSVIVVKIPVGFDTL